MDIMTKLQKLKPKTQLGWFITLYLAGLLVVGGFSMTVHWLLS